jgi:hypothetical protein
MSVTAARLAFGMSVCLQLVAREGGRPWAELVARYSLHELMHVTPTDWSVTETSREVRLARWREPGAG